MFVNNLSINSWMKKCIQFKTEVYNLLILNVINF